MKVNIYDHQGKPRNISEGDAVLHGVVDASAVHYRSNYSTVPPAGTELADVVLNNGLSITAFVDART